MQRYLCFSEETEFGPGQLVSNIVFSNMVIFVDMKKYSYDIFIPPPRLKIFCNEIDLLHALLKIANITFTL